MSDQDKTESEKSQANHSPNNSEFICSENIEEMEIKNYEDKNSTSQNLHMSAAIAKNLVKIPKSQYFSMKMKDIEFIRQTIMKVTIPQEKSRKDTILQDEESKILHRNDQKELKIKKWSSEEVGKLIFCLWQIHEKRGSGQLDLISSVNSPKYEIASLYSTSTKNVLSVSFYRSLKELFDNCNISKFDEDFSEKRTHDIIYSKLQK